MRRTAFKLIASWFNDLCVPKGFAIRAGPLIGATALVFVPRAGIGRCGGRGLLGHGLPPGSSRSRQAGRTYGGDVLLVSTPRVNADTCRNARRLKRCSRSTGRRALSCSAFPPEISGEEFDDEKRPRGALAYGVKFPMFEKAHVLGDQVTPLYRQPAAAAAGRRDGTSTDT